MYIIICYQRYTGLLRVSIIDVSITYCGLGMCVPRLHHYNINSRDSTVIIHVPLCQNVKCETKIIVTYNRYRVYIIVIDEIGNNLDKTIRKKRPSSVWSYRKSRWITYLRVNRTTDHYSDCIMGINCIPLEYYVVC